MHPTYYGGWGVGGRAALYRIKRAVIENIENMITTHKIIIHEEINIIYLGYLH